MKTKTIIGLLFLFTMLILPISSNAQDRCPPCGGKCNAWSGENGGICEETRHKNKQEAISTSQQPCQSCSGECYTSNESENMCTYGEDIFETISSQRNHHEFIKDSTIHCQNQDGTSLINGFTLSKSLYEYVFRGGSGYECGYHKILGAYSLKTSENTHIRSIRQIFQKYNDPKPYDAVCEREDSTYSSSTTLNQYVSYNAHHPLIKSTFWNNKTWFEFHFSKNTHSKHLVEGYFTHSGRTVWEEGISQFKGYLKVGSEKTVVKMTCTTTST